jgi:hypothetical protein
MSIRVQTCAQKKLGMTEKMARRGELIETTPAKVSQVDWPPCPLLGLHHAKVSPNAQRLQ